MMTGNTNTEDKVQARKTAIALILLVALVVIASFMMLPLLLELISIHLSPGLGLKDSAIISFFLTMVIMVVFAVSAGDGLLGEIQFILSGFFLFFVIIWLSLAWIF